MFERATSVREAMSHPREAAFLPGTFGICAGFTAGMPLHKELRQVVAEIPRDHHLLILNETTDIEETAFYIQESARNGWSRNVLMNLIKADSYSAALKESKQHNFSTTLPVQLVEQAEETLKREYSLEFLGSAEPVRERELGNKMIEHIRNVILALHQDKFRGFVSGQY